MQINGIFNISKKENIFSDCICSYAENSKYIFNVIGEDSEKTSEILKDEYQKADCHIIKKIDSLFIAVIFDKEEKSLHIFSDLFSSEYNLYYTFSDNNFYYSTSLKWLLKASEIHREFDRSGVDEFLTNGFILGKNTLIKNVEKLTAGVEIIVDENGINYKSISVSADEISNADAKNNLLNTLQKKIESCADGKEKIDMPISGGYDSNLILNTLVNNTDSEIRTFSIGEESETNEITRVRQNMKLYKNVELNVSIVTDDFFESFSDIVWRLDGCVYEAGIVLQYALAKAVSEKGGKDLICGEFADQLMNKNFDADRKKALSKKHDPFQSYTYVENPFVKGSMLILKKSAVMLNSFGITGHYPFASESLTPFSKALADDNGTNKKFYISKCVTVFPEEVVSNIAKEAGATRNQAFISEEKFEEVKAKLNSIEEVSYICKKTNSSKATVGGQAKKMINIAKKVSKNVKMHGVKTGLTKSFSTAQSKSLDTELQKLYLLIFNELFISQKHDNCFENSSAPLTSTQILDGYLK